MGVEVAGTEHVATARFNVAGVKVEIGFRFVLCCRIQEKKPDRKDEERKQEQTVK